MGACGSLFKKPLNSKPFAVVSYSSPVLGAENLKAGQRLIGT